MASEPHVAATVADPPPVPVGPPQGQPAKVARPVAAPKRAAGRVPSRSRTRSLVLAAAVLVAAAIGVPQGARWLSMQAPPQAALDGDSLPAVAAEPAPPAGDQQPDAGKTTAADAGAGRSTATAKPKPAPARPSGSRRAPTKPAAEPEAPVQALAAAPVLPIAEPAPLAAPPAVAEAPRAAVPEAPTGRLFEAKDVDESPQVATRVEPRVPADLLAQSLNDVVVVRVLVSQSGHPFRVSLLRRSRLGRSVDDAVVAAVTQWTFEPARKKGEAVSSWYHIGVPIGEAH